MKVPKSMLNNTLDMTADLFDVSWEYNAVIVMYNTDILSFTFPWGKKYFNLCDEFAPVGELTCCLIGSIAVIK